MGVLEYTLNRKLHIKKGNGLVRLDKDRLLGVKRREAKTVKTQPRSGVSRLII